MPINNRIEKAAPKIEYEIDMLNALSKGMDVEHNSEISNALLESLLLHVRNIYNFLTKKEDNTKYLDKEGQPKEILAIHYFNNESKWKNQIDRLFPYCKKELSSKKESLTLINDHLAHITYSRAETKINWDCRRILEDSKSAWDKFLNTLEVDQRKLFSSTISTIKYSPIGSPGMTSSVSPIFKTSQGFSKTINEDGN